MVRRYQSCREPDDGVADGSSMTIDRRRAVLLRPGGYDRDASHGVLRRGNDEVSLRDRGSHLRLPAVCLDTARPRARAGGIAGSAGGDHDRAHRQEPHPQGSSRGGGAETTWRTPRPGACHLGDGGVRRLSAVARQADAQDLRAWPDSGKCLHYYFYFIDAELGLVYLRVPTWAPFRLHFYCNGHSWLARQLTAEGIGFTAADNAFIRIDDWQRAQDLADRLSPDRLHLVLDRYAAQCCPVLDIFRQSYHWSLMQVEYATDLVFRSVGTLKPLYQHLARESVLSVKAEQIASFLGRQISPQLAQEIGSQFSTRIEGICIKHRFASSSIKMYDKYGCVLRIETTINDVSFFKHHRKVEHRQGPPTRVLAPVKKTIYSLIDLREIMLGCNRRYLAHLAALDDFSAGVRALDRLTKPRTVEQKTLKGINFFDPVDNALLHALQNPRVNIAGIRRADLLPLLDQLSPDRLSRQLRRLRDLGVIKRVAGTYRYYLTRIGRAATAALCRVTQTVIIPALA